MKPNPHHYSYKRRTKAPKVVTGVVPTTTSPMLKLVYKSYLRENNKAMNIRYIYIRVFLGVSMYLICLCLVHIYSFVVSSRWGLNYGFSASFVTPQGLLMQVLMRL